MLARGSLCSSEWTRCWNALFSSSSATHYRCFNARAFHSSPVLFRSNTKSPSKPSINKPKKHTIIKKTPSTKKLETAAKTINNNPPQPKRPLAIQYAEDDSLIKYRPSPSVPPIRAKFTDFLQRARENKINIADITADVSKKELIEMLQYLQGKSNLKDLTIRVKDINSAIATLISKLLQTCENLHSFRIFSADLHGPSAPQSLQILTRGILNSEKLEHLSLETCWLSVQAWDEVVTLLHKTTKIKSIDLKRTKLTDSIAIKLVQAIKDNQNVCLESIDMTKNMINDETVSLVLTQLNTVECVRNVAIKTYDVYRHNWSRTLVEVERKNEERKDEVQAEINKYRNALKEEYVPKPLSTFHSNENEYINPKDKDRIKRKEKENKIVKAYEDFDYLKDANTRDVLKKIKSYKKKVQTKRGMVVKLK